MSTAALQCPDSGLVVVVSSEGTAEGDRDDWAELGASDEAIAATDAWLVRFRRALRQSIASRGRTFEAFADALRHCGGVVSDLYPLTWERGALEGEAEAGAGWDEGAADVALRAMRGRS